MEFYIDNFDTNIFKKDVYKLYLNKDITQNQLENLIGKLKEGIIFCFTIFYPRNSYFLQQAGFNLVSIRNTYKLNISSYLKQGIKDLPRTYETVEKSQAVKRVEKKGLAMLAKSIYQTSRYCKDQLLDSNLALKVYINWVENSLYKDYADEAFLIFDKFTAAGIITIKIKNGAGFIDLLGVIKKYQNQKLATYLLKKAIEYLLSKDIRDIYVITEGENIAANIFYQKNNFIVQKVELAYHKHIKKI